MRRGHVTRRDKMHVDRWRQDRYAGRPVMRSKVRVIAQSAPSFASFLLQSGALRQSPKLIMSDSKFRIECGQGCSYKQPTMLVLILLATRSLGDRRNDALL